MTPNGEVLGSPVVSSVSTTNAWSDLDRKEVAEEAVVEATVVYAKQEVGPSLSVQG